MGVRVDRSRHLKTHGYLVQTRRTSVYSAAERAAAAGKDIEVRDMRAEILTDIAAGCLVGQSRKWQLRAY